VEGTATATAAQITTRITELEERIAAFSGVKSTSFGDQSTTFDMEGALRDLARLRTELATATATDGRYRLAATSKGV